MEWEFTPQQVVRGEVGYGLADFRRDLAAEVTQNLGAAAASDGTFDLLYDLCYWLATGRAAEHFIARFRHDPPVHEFLEQTAPWMRANGEMLGAILQRAIMDEVDNGATLEQAVQAADQAARACED
jgi:hypothetical protein